MKKPFYILLFCLLFLQWVQGQQLPLFTQYNEYQGVINPAYVSFETYHENYHTSIGIAYRDQWTQLPDRPQTMALRYEGSTKNRSGIQLQYGGYFIHDRIGVFATSDLRLRAAAKIKLRDTRHSLTVLSAGLNLGVGRYEVNLADIAYIDDDPILFKENTRTMYPDAGVGVFLYNRFKNDDYFQAGLSIPQLANLNHTFSSDTKEFDIKRVPHYYFTSSYFKLLNDDAYLELSTWVKRVQNVPINFDVILRYKFEANMWLGAGVNSAGIIHTEIGLFLFPKYGKRVKFGYSFNPTFKTHSVIFGNIHEVNLSYSLKR